MTGCFFCDLCSQAWNITQVPAGGVAIVPTVPGVEYADHLKPADAEHFRVFGNHVRAWFKSDCMFKVELKAAHHFGRSGYFRLAYCVDMDVIERSRKFFQEFAT